MIGGLTGPGLEALGLFITRLEQATMETGIRLCPHGSTAIEIPTQGSEAAFDSHSWEINAVRDADGATRYVVQPQQ